MNNYLTDRFFLTLIQTPISQNTKIIDQIKEIYLNINPTKIIKKNLLLMIKNKIKSLEEDWLKLVSRLRILLPNLEK